MRIERRRERRSRVSLPCRVQIDGGSLAAEIIELSATGARLRLTLAIPAAGLWTLRAIEVPGVLRADASLRWQAGNVAGVAFDRPSAAAARLCQDVGCRA